jgi:Arc/MetJ-type ribon-helix-helix transcriptional regulator
MMYCHTEGNAVPKTKVAVTLDSGLLGQVDHLVAKRRFQNRSQAIETALAEKLARLNRTRLAEECKRLDPDAEKAMAEEGLHGSIDTWPEY